jgi:hypothetical protein
VKYLLAINIVLVISSYAMVYGQSVSEDMDISGIMDRYFAEEEETDLESVIQDLLYFSENPVDLNSATEEDLSGLHLLSDFQVYVLLNYRQTTGSFLSLNELFYIPGIPVDLAKDLMKFVTVSGNYKINVKDKIRLVPVRGKFLLRFEDSKITDGSDSATNSESKGYAGNSLKMYSGLRATLGNKLEAAVLMEKDAGEEFFGSNKAGFDFYSGYIKYSGKGIISNACIGDYYLEYGQGLQLWSNSSFGKSSNIYSLKKTGRGIKGSTSRNENLFLRGGAVTLHKGDLYLTPFVSFKKFDANVIRTDSSDYFTSFQESGLHRTVTEIEDEDAGQERLLGANLQWKSENINIGMTFSSLSFKDDYLPSEELYNLKDFRGKTTNNVSADYSAFLKKAQLFGEMGYGNNHMAVLNGASFYISGDITFSIIYRWYQTGYFSRYANALSENTRISNEQGLLLGMECYPFSNFRISGYFDFFKFPGLSYGRSSPAGGNEYLLSADYTVYDKFKLCFRYKSEIKSGDYKEELVIPILTDARKDRMKVSVKYPLNRIFELTSAFQSSRITNDSSDNYTGYLVYQDVKIRPEKFPVEISLRYSVFNIEDYEARLYTYERDYAYTYTSVMNYRSGQRLNLFLKVHAGPSLVFWGSYSLLLPESEEFDKVHIFKIQANMRF